MNSHPLIDELRTVGISLKARAGELIVNGPRGNVTPALVASLKRLKPALLAALKSTPKPPWRMDERGRLIFPDGTIYTRTTRGGWILTRHPKRGMISPGTFTPKETTPQPTTHQQKENHHAD